MPPPEGPSTHGRKPAKDPPEVIARVEQELDLVDLIARQLGRQIGRTIAFDELLSFGREGLLTAARNYDPDRGVPFRKWASIRVRGAMIDGIRSLSTVPRSVYRHLRAIEDADRVQEGMVEEHAASPVGSAEQADERLSAYMAGIATAVAMGLLGERSGGEGEAADRHPSAEERLVREELFAAIRAAVELRPDAERKLILRHYFDDVTFEQAAEELGLSKSWASRLHARAVEAIARELKRAKKGP